MAISISRSLLLTVALSLIATLGLSPSPVLAQGSGRGGGEVFQTETVDLQFPGGTVEEYVKSVHRAVGPSLIVVMKSDDIITLPPIELSGVPLAGAIGVLDGYDQRVNEKIVRVSVRENSGVYVVQYSLHGAPDPQPKRAAVWSIEELIDPDMPAQDILAAVETAMSTFQNPATIKYHVETGLLIARATPEQLGTIESVLDSLGYSVEAKRRKREEGSHVDQYELEWKKAKLNLRRETELLGIAEARLEESEQLYEQGMVPLDGVLESRRNVSMQRLAIEEALLEVEHFARLLERIKNEQE